MRTCSIVVQGRVQGVGFRLYAVRRAEVRGIVGRVCNRASGDVRIVASGPPQAMAAFLEDLREGPVLARVESVTVEEIERLDPPETSMRVVRDEY